jgi:hypothetical protein
MTETPHQKIQRINDALRVVMLFDGVDFQELTDPVVQCMSGFETFDLDGIIKLDILAVSMANDDLLAFVLAHVHWHLGEEVVFAEDSPR